MAVKYFKKTADGEIQLPTLKTYNDLNVNGTANVNELSVNGVDTISYSTITGKIEDSLIYPAVQYTNDGQTVAFYGTLYNIPNYISSEQIPSGAKLMHLEANQVYFLDSYPPKTGLKYGSAEDVAANKAWINNSQYMGEREVITCERVVNHSANPSSNVATISFPSGYRIQDLQIAKIFYNGFFTEITSEPTETNIVDSEGRTVYLQLVGDPDDYKVAYIKMSLAEEVPEGYTCDLDFTLSLYGRIAEYHYQIASFSYKVETINIADERISDTISERNYIDDKQSLINKELDKKVADNTTDVSKLKTDVSKLKTDVSDIKNKTYFTHNICLKVASADYPTTFDSQIYFQYKSLKNTAYSTWTELEQEMVYKNQYISGSGFYTPNYYDSEEARDEIQRPVIALRKGKYNGIYLDVIYFDKTEQVQQRLIGSSSTQPQYTLTDIVE